jgi:hypothetical protein
MISTIQNKINDEEFYCLYAHKQNFPFVGRDSSSTTTPDIK